jgi:hypothetical protein
MKKTKNSTTKSWKHKSSIAENVGGSSIVCEGSAENAGGKKNAGVRRKEKRKLNSWLRSHGQIVSVTSAEVSVV